MAAALLAAINDITPPPNAELATDVYNGTLTDIDAAGDLPVTPASANETAGEALASNLGPLGLAKRSSDWARHARRHRKHPRHFGKADRLVSRLGKRTSSTVEQAISLGYSDGFQTGRTFAATNLSKLGFVNQFINDALASHIANQEIEASDRTYYLQWFQSGLKDSEALVYQAITAQGGL